MCSVILTCQVVEMGIQCDINNPALKSSRVFFTNDSEKICQDGRISDVLPNHVLSSVYEGHYRFNRAPNQTRIICA